MNGREERLRTVALLHALERLPTVEVRLSARDLWMVISALQLAHSHPHIGLVGDHIWRIGHELAAALSADPGVAALMEQGWDRAHDVPIGEVASSKPLH